MQLIRIQLAQMLCKTLPQWSRSRSCVGIQQSNKSAATESFYATLPCAMKPCEAHGAFEFSEVMAAWRICSRSAKSWEGGLNKWGSTMLHVHPCCSYGTGCHEYRA